MGVNASGSQKEVAADFVMSMLSKELQTEARNDGFPVNREAVAEQLEEYEPEETYGWTSHAMESSSPKMIRHSPDIYPVSYIPTREHQSSLPSISAK